MTRIVAWAKHNGCGEFVFRQAGHPENDKHLGPEWQPLYAEPVQETSGETS